MSILNFDNIEASEMTIRRTWETFRDEIATGKIKYYETEKALEVTFLKQLNDYFNNNGGKYYFEKLLVEFNDREMVRGGRIKDKKELVHKRFIPDKDYINEDNRFSPKGVEWLYLAIGNGQKYNAHFSEAEICAIKECKILEGEWFAICPFSLSLANKELKVVDLSIAEGLSYDEINNIFKEYEKKTKRNARRLAKIGIVSSINKQELQEVLTEWFAYTYAKLISEQIFKPVESKEKEYQYAPFHCLAQYFRSLGYEGIVYSSVAYSKGKNIVLFDKSYAQPKGEIKDFIFGPLQK